MSRCPVACTFTFKPKRMYNHYWQDIREKLLRRDWSDDKTSLKSPIAGLYSATPCVYTNIMPTAIAKHVLLKQSASHKPLLVPDGRFFDITVLGDQFVQHMFLPTAWLLRVSLWVAHIAAFAFLSTTSPLFFHFMHFNSMMESVRCPTKTPCPFLACNHWCQV